MLIKKRRVGPFFKSIDLNSKSSTLRLFDPFFTIITNQGWRSVWNSGRAFVKYVSEKVGLYCKYKKFRSCASWPASIPPPLTRYMYYILQFTILSETFYGKNLRDRNGLAANFLHACHKIGLIFDHPPCEEFRTYKWNAYVLVVFCDHTI